MWITFISASLLATMLPVQPTVSPTTTRRQDPCPHQITRPVPIDVHYGPASEQCGGGFELEWGGVKLRAPRGGACPLFAVIVPPHHAWTTDKSSPTYVVPGKTGSIVKIDFKCQISF